MKKKQQIVNFFYSQYESFVWFVLTTLEMQLFLSCIYIPILTYWGLSWPILSIMSTPFFTPLFIIFLIISFIIFVNALFCESVYYFFVIFLDLVTATWIFILKSPPFKYQLGFCVPPFIFLCMLPCAALYIISSVRVRMYRTFYLIISIILFYGITLVMGMTKPICQIIQTDRGLFYLISCNNKKIIVDARSWKQAIPYPSWFFYTLIPAITKASGAVKVDIWIILSYKKNFFRFVDAISAISPDAHIFTHERNYSQLKFSPYVYPINSFEQVFFKDQMRCVVNNQSIILYCKEKIVFQSFFV